MYMGGVHVCLPQGNNHSTHPLHLSGFAAKLGEISFPSKHPELAQLSVLVFHSVSSVLVLYTFPHSLQILQRTIRQDVEAQQKKHRPENVLVAT